MVMLFGRGSAAPLNVRARRSMPEPRASLPAPANTLNPKPSLQGRTSAASRPLPEPPSPRVIGGADLVLTALIITLIAFGVVMVYSASAVTAVQRFHGTGHLFLLRQALYAVVGLTAMWLFTRIDYHLWRRFTYYGLAAALALVVYSLVRGRSAGGASRWIDLGLVNLQPVEILKVAVVMWLAHSLARKAERIKTFTIGFLPHLIGAVVLAALCNAQPDFGSAVMIVLLTFFLLFTAGARLGYLLGAVLVGLPIAFQLVAGTEYRMRRITGFLAPFENRSDEGYQLWESLIGFGSGGLTGTGFGDSRQKLMFLPEAHTDFISAIVAEELGLIGFATLTAVFAAVVWRGLRAAFRSVDEYGLYLASGLTLLLGTQALTNLAVAVGLIPTKGLALPFVSYGGTSLVMSCVAMGLVLNVSRPRAAGANSGARGRVAPMTEAVTETGGVA